MSVKPIPDGYGPVTPYLIVEGVDALLRFLAEAFGAEERHRFHRPDGSVMHAETRIRGAAIMMGEPMGEFAAMPSSVYLYVPDCDAVFARAVEAGGVSVMVPTTMEHAGERFGGVRDPSGNIWWVATHVENVSADEQKRRMAAHAES